MSKPTITEFLEARIAEDEDDALPDAGWEGYQGYCDAAGVHHSPERALAECAAKRAIIGAHAEDVFRGHLSNGCKTCFGGAGWPCPTLLPLAAVYASHPDYQQEWAL